MMAEVLTVVHGLPQPGVVCPMSAQQLAEADPAGQRIGQGPWPAAMRDNQRESARFRRAA
jgi:hypothetical protein